MRTKVISGFLSSLFAMILLLSFIPMKAQCSGYTVDEVQSLIDGIIAYKLDETGSGSVQDWINGDLTDGAGAYSEWYIASLSQYGDYDLSSYEAALRDYLSSNNVPSATSREKYSLSLAAAGSTDPYMADIIDTSVGQQGIMSWIYGLHVLNNGYTGSKYNTSGVIDTLLSLQYSDGGWAIFGANGDIDVTAMTISSLAPYYTQRSDVHSAVDRGLAFLSQRQQSDGGYISFGTPNTESTAQVLLALSSLGIDCETDERFIKDGNSLIDGMMQYHLDNGSFSHTNDGASNESATVQALYSLIAYKRMCNGRGPFWVFDSRQPVKRDSGGSTGSGSGNAVKPSVPGTATDVHSDNGTSSDNGAALTDNRTTSPAAPACVTTTTSVSGTGAVSVTTTLLSSKTTGKLTTLSVTTSGSSTAELTSSSRAAESGEKGGIAKKNGYKVKAVIIILTAAGVLCIVVFAAGKRNYKNFIAVAAAAGIAITVVMMTNIQSKDDYYNGEKVHKDDAIGTVTMTIRCDTIAGKSDSEFVPDDGVILDVTEFDLAEGETVFDILTEAARTYCIQVENKGSAGSAHGMVYISGINYIYEMDYGDLSGWVYHVNGITPSKNCGDYVLEDGDRIEWLYTCELGHDLDEVYEE